MQRVEHVNQLARGVRINDWLAGAWVGVAPQHHGCVAAQHANQILKRGRTLWRVGCRGRFAVGVGSRRSWCCCPLLLGFLARFAFLFLDDLLPQFAFRGKGPTIYDAERLFWFLLWHGQPQLVSLQVYHAFW